MELAKSNPSTSVRPIADYSQKIARPQTVNPVTSSDSSLIKPQPLINESESKIATNAAVMEEKRRILAAQMREQAVAEAKSAQLVLAVDEKTLKPEALLQDFLVAPLNAPCNNNIDHKPKATNASSPMETYEMSDKEDADSSVEESSDSEEDDNDVQPRKKVSAPIR